MITRYWNRTPGKFVDKNTGLTPEIIEGLATGPSFTGTIREWYETLIEDIKGLHFDTKRKANVIIMSSNVMHILSCTSMFEYSDDTSEFSGLQKFGTLNNCGLDVYVEDGDSSVIEFAFLRNRTKGTKSTKRTEVAKLEVQDCHTV